MTLRLTCAFSNNPRVQPLKDGAVRCENIDLEFVTVGAGELFFRNLTYDEFDISEMSISEMLLSKERGDGTKWDWSGIPVFMSKASFWLGIMVNTSSGIEKLSDLKGKRVGVPDYDMTAALWMRVILKELYGIEASDITWFNGRTKELSHGGALGLDKDPPRGVTLNWLTSDQTFDKMLDAGELDAAFGVDPSPPSPGDRTFAPIDRYAGTPLTGNPRIRRLFSDGGQEVITEFYRKTGIIPVNHMVIVQNRVLREHPWVALELFKACQQSKEIAYDRARRAAMAYMLFPGNDFKEQASVFGAEPYPFGIEANRNLLERLIQGSLEQGLIRERAKIENIFFRTTLDT
jgi:4,5-dihydroxyphthalate decarboxylase